ncbi:exopolysaccharide synthesis protein [Stanieria sp. NIES-3757]|nr:exopolysaccharide synthesis protein [Stanieria sp. NIES-3757]
MAKLSLELNRYFFEEERQSDVTLAELLDLAGERIFGFLLVILSFPSALPIPAPGYSIPFGILMFILALQLISGRQRPWLPAKMMKSSMKLETVQGVLQKGIPWLQKIEALSKPRLSYICTGLTGRIIMGIAIALMSISMMIPIPGTNTLPAMGIWVTGFGLMEDDGVICLAGLLLSAVAGTLSTSIIIAVIWGGSSLLDVIKAWLAS